MTWRLDVQTALLYADVEWEMWVKMALGYEADVEAIFGGHEASQIALRPEAKPHELVWDHWHLPESGYKLFKMIRASTFVTGRPQLISDALRTTTGRPFFFFT